MSPPCQIRSRVLFVQSLKHICVSICYLSIKTIPPIQSATDKEITDFGYVDQSDPHHIHPQLSYQASAIYTKWLRSPNSDNTRTLRLASVEDSQVDGQTDTLQLRAHHSFIRGQQLILLINTLITKSHKIPTENIFRRCGGGGPLSTDHLGSIISSHFSTN